MYVIRKSDELNRNSSHRNAMFRKHDLFPVAT